MSETFNFITKVEVFLNPKTGSNLLGWGSFTTQEGWEISFRIISGSRGPFIGLPTRPYKKSDGGEAYAREVQLASDDRFQYMQDTVLAAYKEATKPRTAEAPTDKTDALPKPLDGENEPISNQPF